MKFIRLGLEELGELLDYRPCRGDISPWPVVDVYSSATAEGMLTRRSL